MKGRATPKGSSRLFIISALVFITHSVHGIPSLQPPTQDFGNSDPDAPRHHSSLVMARLPDTTLLPHRYRLEIRPILDPDTGTGEQFTAPGKLWVTGTARAATNQIVLNAVNIQIPNQSLSVVDETDGRSLVVTNGAVDTAQEFFTVSLESNLVLGRNYTLFMEFVSVINTQDAVGLYASVYTAADNSTRYLVSTDFQAPDARLAFPNFDEPHLKAVWEMDIIRQGHYQSLANMNRISTAPVVGLPGIWFRDSYAPTVRMSSYLICFAVSDFSSETANSSIYAKPVTIWGPPPLMERGDGKFSPDFSAKLMALFENYYGIEYSLPKMDKISIPDYSSGAMENWGLNTYRDTRLLFNEDISTAQDLFSMTNTISHELVHQWWGNLVTCEWWSDLWIQEGAATYYAPVGVEGVGMGDLEPIQTLITASVQRSFDFDGNKELTHPIHNADVDPANVAVLFDALTYHKGASLIRMMNAIVSTDTYNIAMTRFLQRYEYSTANQNQMFAVLDEIIAESPASSPLPTGVTLTQVMETWTLQPGFPVVTVDRNPFTNNVTFSQEKFFQRKEEGAGDSTMWHIPIAVLRSTSGGVIPLRPERWLRNDQASTYLVPVQGDWIIVNPQTHGYYRVLYTNSLLDPIIAQLMSDHTVFDVQIRSALVDDNLNLGYAGYLELNKALTLTLYLRNERSLFPWQSFFTNMALPYRMYARSSDFTLFKKYILNVTANALGDIGISPQPGEPNPTTLLRTRLVEWRCNLQDASCVAQAKLWFSMWMTNPSVPQLVAPDLQPIVYCTAVANGGDAEWDFIWGQYLAADRDVMQTSLIRALACSKTSFRLNRLMEMALETNSGVRNKHRTLTMQAVAGNSGGVDLAFTFLRSNWDAMIRRFGVSMPSGLITTLSTQVSSPLEIQDLENFVASVPQLQLSPTVVENLAKGAHWRSNIRGDFTTFLQTANITSSEF